jgi:tRNA(Ile2) C34 agmatinyltransferase TiaS
MGIILRTQALGVTKRGSYFKYFTHRETVKDEVGRPKVVKTRLQQLVPACEAVSFKCPWKQCGKVNSQSLLNAKVIAGEILGFTCSKCGRELEIVKPRDEMPSIIVPGMQIPKPAGLVNSQGRPLVG